MLDAMKKVSNQEETIVDNQLIATQKRLNQILGHLDPMNPPEICPIKDVLANISDKWSTIIILLLGAHGILRFNALKRTAAGISSKILAERLKRMERDGYIIRTLHAEVPIRVEYKLSEFGIKYLDQLLDLTEWIEREMPAILKRRIQFDKLVN